MQQFIYPALFCAAIVFSASALASTTEETTVQPLTTVTLQNNTTEWKQANQKVAELGGWQYYANEAGGHPGMDHSRHSMPVDHSKHSESMDHSKHSESMDHSSHSMSEDHSKHSESMDHSKHSESMDHSRHSMPVDHSRHSESMDHSRHSESMDHSSHSMSEDHSRQNKVKTGNEDEHHH